MRSRSKELARFALGGLVSSAVVLGMSALVRESGLAGERVAAAIGLATALVVNFHLMRHFVFRGNRRPVVRQALEFLSTSGVFRGIEYLAFLIVSSGLHVHYLLALALVLGTSFILKFLVYEGWVFKRS